MNSVIPIGKRLTMKKLYNRIPRSDLIRGNECRLKTLSSIRVVPPGTLHLTGKFRVRWDLFIITLALYNTFLDPYWLAFDFSSDLALYVYVIDIIIDIVFIVDIYFNFRTTYIDNFTGEEVIARKKIRRKYLRSGRLIIDVVSCIPFSLIGFFAETDSSVALVKLLKLTRILRISKIIFYMRVDNDIKMPLRLCNLILFIIVFLHILACFWMLLVSNQEKWVPIPYTIRDTNFYDIMHYEQYFLCFYTAIYTIVGMEMLPVDLSTYMFASVFIVIGILLFTYMLGEIAVLIYNINFSETKFTRKLDMITTMMIKLRLDKNLQTSILDYYIKMHKLLIRNEEWEAFRTRIPPRYISKINKHVYGGLISTHSVFREHRESVNKIVDNIDPFFLPPSNSLITQGDESDDFYIIVNGELQVWVNGLDNKTHLVRNLGSGDYCGEIGLIYGVNRTATVISNDFSSVGYLRKEIFLELVQENSQLEREFKLKISELDDPYRNELRNLLKRIPYLQKTDNLLKDQLIFNMKQRTFEKNTFLFEEHARATKVYFLIRGVVNVYAYVEDFFLKKIMKKCPQTRMHKKSSSTLKARHLSEKEMPLNLIEAKKVKIKLSSLGAGSILCAKQALFSEEFQIHCTTKKKSKLLVLDSQFLYELARHNKSLSKYIEMTMNRYRHYNEYFDDYMYIPPALDWYQHFSDHSELRRSRLCFKLKNTIFMVIFRKRPRIRLNYGINRSFVQRVNAIQIAEENKWDYLAKMIQNNQVNFTIIKIARFLKEENIKKPIIYQFANIARKLSYDGYPQIIQRNEDFEESVKECEGTIESVLVKIRQVQRLFAIFNEFLF